jgi:hypothetical protein
MTAGDTVSSPRYPRSRASRSRSRDQGRVGEQLVQAPEILVVAQPLDLVVQHRDAVRHEQFFGELAQLLGTRRRGPGNSRDRRSRTACRRDLLQPSAMVFAQALLRLYGRQHHKVGAEEVDEVRTGLRLHLPGAPQLVSVTAHQPRGRGQRLERSLSKLRRGLRGVGSEGAADQPRVDVRMDRHDAADEKHARISRFVVGDSLPP